MLLNLLPGLFPNGLLIAAIILLATPTAEGLSNRRLWFYESLLRTPVILSKEKISSQFKFEGNQYLDSLMLSAGTLVNLRFMDLRFSYSRLLHAKFTDEGKQRNNALIPLRNNFGIEVGRYFVTENNHFGKTGLSLLYFFPGKISWVGPVFDSGIIESPQLPWSVIFHSYLLVGTTSGEKILSAGCESKKLFYLKSTSKFGFGGEITWHYLIANDEITPMSGEYMMFLVGPTMHWENAFGRISAKVSFRISLDSEYASSKTLFPTEVALPGITFNWTTFL